MREEESKRQLMVIQSGNRHETQMPFVRIKKMKEVSSQGKRFQARQRPGYNFAPHELSLFLSSSQGSVGEKETDERSQEGSSIQGSVDKVKGKGVKIRGQTEGKNQEKERSERQNFYKDNEWIVGWKSRKEDTRPTHFFPIPCCPSSDSFSGLFTWLSLVSVVSHVFWPHDRMSNHEWKTQEIQGIQRNSIKEKKYPGSINKEENPGKEGMTYRLSLIQQQTLHVILCVNLFLLLLCLLLFLWSKRGKRSECPKDTNSYTSSLSHIFPCHASYNLASLD